jgi:ribonuclease BN (tRNA processing enzyme)
MISSHDKNIKNLSQSLSDDQSGQRKIIARINGVLPDKRRLGNQQTSERYAEIVQSGMETNTSCSIFIRDTKQNTQDSLFHILFDLGEGVISSVEKGLSDLGMEKYLSVKGAGQPNLHSTPAIGSPLLLSSSSSKTENSALQSRDFSLFDALLISHSHEDHINDLSKLILRQNSIADDAPMNKIRAYCTRTCKEYVMKDLVSRTSLTKEQN